MGAGTCCRDCRAHSHVIMKLIHYVRFDFREPFGERDLDISPCKLSLTEFRNNARDPSKLAIVRRGVSVSVKLPNCIGGDANGTPFMWAPKESFECVR